jgi:hypothetical protein
MTNSNREQAARERRTSLFANTTALKPTKIQTKPNLAEIDFINRHMHLDHISAWHSSSGALFILNEPYYCQKAEISALEESGYEVRVVPTNLAPYCGRFNPEEGAQPWTTSLLITTRNNADELELIYQDLLKAARFAPAWNTQ